MENFSSEALTIESLSCIFLAKFKLQSVMCICNLCCQNPTEQGITLSLLTTSFKRSVGFFKYWSRFLIVTLVYFKFSYLFISRDLI